MRRYCSFCGRDERECTLLVVGPEDGTRTVAICKDCIGEVAGLAARHARLDRAGPILLGRCRQVARAEASYRYGDDPGDAA